MKKTVIVATKNAHKLSEMAALLDGVCGIELKSMKEIGLDAEIEENGTTFEENAKIKAREVCRITGMPAIADDSGLSVDYLSGEPGIYSARYASENGQNASDDANNKKLLEKLKNVPECDRTARFVSAVALVLPDGREFSALGVCEGIIMREERGNGGFGYDPLFFCPEFSKTFGELSPEQKNSVSHRNRACLQLRKILENTNI